MIGVVAVVLATLIKKERAELSLIIGMSATVIIFLYVLSQIQVVLSFVAGMIDMISLEETYYYQLLKMLGVAYVAEFASAICKDSGHNAISGMIELFAKLTIVALSIPGIVFLVETIGEFI
jgi:stage III sporulation protein AD